MASAGQVPAERAGELRSRADKRRVIMRTL
jgi:hypothetical protein